MAEVTEPAPGWLAEALLEVTEALTAALVPAFDAFEALPYIAEKVQPPCAWVALGAPVLTGGLAFGEYQLRLDIPLIAPQGTNQSQTSDLIRMVEGALPALIKASWSIEQVGEPYMLTANNAQYLAATVTVLGAVRPREEVTA